jgi:hypothetical protein
MEDFFNEQKLRKEVLNWCDKNLFLDAYDYVPKNKHKFFEGKKKIDIFLSLSITTWMLIINDKINENGFSIRPNHSSEDSMRNIMFFLLNLQKSLM